LSYNWNVYKIFNNGRRAKAPMYTFTYADEDKVQEYFDAVVKENFEEKIRRWNFTLLRADLPQERKAEVVDEESDWNWQWAAVQNGTSQYLAGLSPTFKSHIQANEWMNEKIKELAR
jgi:hypothetical protein